VLGPPFDRKIRLFEPGTMPPSLCCLSTRTYELDLSAGPYTAIVTPAEPHGLLKSPPICRRAPYPNAHDAIPRNPDPGDCLMITIEGLIERRGRPIDDRTRIILMLGARHTSQTVCASTMAALLRGTSATDDWPSRPCGGPKPSRPAARTRPATTPFKRGKCPPRVLKVLIGYVTWESRHTTKRQTVTDSRRLRRAPPTTTGGDQASTSTDSRTWW